MRALGTRKCRRALLGAAAISLFIITVPIAPAIAAPIVIVQTRSLYFGVCDDNANTTYTIDPADNPGIAGCTGGYSARFDITGDAGAKVTISIPNSVFITNGTDSLKVTFSNADTGGNPPKFDGLGNLIIWIGGQFKIPVQGLGSSGTFTLPVDLDVIYK